MIKIEQRKETRIPGKNLPKEYRTFTILLENGDKHVVPCIDASLNGFSFFTDLSSDSFYPGTEVCLYLEGIDHPIHGLIVSSDETKDGVRKGVSFQASKGYSDYRSVFHIIVNNLSAEMTKNSTKQ